MLQQNQELGKKLQLAGEEVWMRFFDSRLYEPMRLRRGRSGLHGSGSLTVNGQTVPLEPSVLAAVVEALAEGALEPELVAGRQLVHSREGGRLERLGFGEGIALASTGLISEGAGG